MSYVCIQRKHLPHTTPHTYLIATEEAEDRCAFLNAFANGALDGEMI